MLKNFEDFIAYCKTLKGVKLETDARGKQFSVSVDGSRVYFIPASSGKPRRANNVKTERVLRDLTGMKAWAPGDYRHITRHASYILAVARHCLDNRR